MKTLNCVVCGQLASFRRVDSALLCQAHNDEDISNAEAKGLTPMERVGVWEEIQQEGEEAVEQEVKDFVPPAISFEDFHAWVLQQVAKGWPEGLLLKMAMVSIRQREIAAERWQRLEYGRSKSAPLWLDEKEAEKLLGMLRGQKSVEARLIRQSIEMLFSPLRRNRA